MSSSDTQSPSQIWPSGIGVARTPAPVGLVQGLTLGPWSLSGNGTLVRRLGALTLAQIGPPGINLSHACRRLGGTGAHAGVMATRPGDRAIPYLLETGC